MVSVTAKLVFALLSSAYPALASRGVKKLRAASFSKGYPGTPSWDSYKTATFLVEGAGDAMYNGCYVFARFDAKDAFTMAYVNSANSQVYLHFAEWMGCGALVPKNCRHNGWWLSQRVCADGTGTWEELSCKKKGAKDAYFATGQPVDGKIPTPSTMQWGCPPMMDGSTLAPESRAVRQDSNSTMYASNCDEPPPTVSMNACSPSKPVKKAPAPKSNAVCHTSLVALLSSALMLF